MNNNPDSARLTEQSSSRQHSLRSHRVQVEHSDASDSESSAKTTQLPTIRRNSRRLLDRSEASPSRASPLFAFNSLLRASRSDSSLRHLNNTNPGSGSRSSSNNLAHQRGGGTCISSIPGQADTSRRHSSISSEALPVQPTQVIELDPDVELLEENYELPADFALPGLPHPANSTGSRSSLRSSRQRHRLLQNNQLEESENDAESDARSAPMVARTRRRDWLPSQSSHDDSGFDSAQTSASVLKRSRDKFESGDAKDVLRALKSQGAIAVITYRSGTADPKANDVWPSCRTSAKVPARYHPLMTHPPKSPGKKMRQSVRTSRTKVETTKDNDGRDEEPKGAPIGRPQWNLPVELVELVASYLNRDDIKSLRLVSREFNLHVSQVIFKTVVVPFNTEIYGMLGQEPRSDLVGQGNTEGGASAFTWENTDGDDVYNGHGLDVFRGFGQHIVRYGMSFEVSEDALADPPSKSSTERHTSFWGSFDWPFERYRRFEDVAGLETAADETPRMKVAFSELSKVKELALSVDGGLGWLTGPDRSIRARILQRPPEVFGTLKEIPDRRVKAQQELWEYIEKCHQTVDSDVKLATLYRLETKRSLSELQEASTVIDAKPKLPYLEPPVIRHAVPHQTAEVLVPTTLDDPEVRSQIASSPASPEAGILFSSNSQPAGAGHLVGPIIPANLTKAQQEWLLETEWAQRAFLSSYMLSIIDNKTTFNPVHTLTIPRLSDRYIPMLNRVDFWDSLPNLRDVTLIVLPSWRSVSKDEAGFVETPKINPSRGIDLFYELLCRVVSRRENINKLTIGWATGGEHAEGVHARNKLVLPAPLMVAEVVTSQNHDSVWEELLRFPFVEHLTLRNSWITPPALLQFVKLHDKLKLKHMALDSVSLTAILRPHNNGHPMPGIAQNIQPAMAGLLGLHGQMVAGLANGQAPQTFTPGQMIQIHIQALQQQVQQIQPQHLGAALQANIVALQAQLHNHNQLQQQHLTTNQTVNQGQQQQTHTMQQSQQAPATMVQAAHVQQQQAFQPPVAYPQPTPNGQSALGTEPRQGSWVFVLDIMTPGPNLSDLGSWYSRADPERITALRSIHFNSCGYVRLPYSQFDQSALETTAGYASYTRNPIFTKRYSALAPAMLSGKWPLLGEIVQDMKPAELAALNAGWNLETGWQDAEAARAVEFDGLLPGGTGRFTGVVRAEDRVSAAGLP